MNTFLVIAVGGGLGSVARYWTATSVYAWLGKDFPYGTLVVNVAGGLLMGLLTELLVARLAVAVEWRLFLLVGFLGGFTTFSTFSMETWLLLQDGDFAKAGLNALLSVVLCVVAVWIGLHVARLGFAQEWHRWASMEAYGARLLMLGGLAYSLGLAVVAMSMRLSWTQETQVLLVLALLTLLAPGGAWYLWRAPDDAGRLLLAFFYSALLGSGGLWLGLWSGERLS